MRLCQSVRYALSIYAICFLLNGISTAEDNVREQHNTVASKTSNEPEGKTIKKSTRSLFYFELLVFN